MFLFEEKARLQKSIAGHFKIEASAIEIYCDQLRDLLSEDPQTMGLGIDFRMDPYTKKVFVKGQTWKELKNVSEFLSIIKASNMKRVFGQNGWNAHSSRSHHVFQIRISR